MLHTYSDRYGTHSHLNKFAPRMVRKAGLIGNNLRKLDFGGVRQRRPRPYSMELPPAFEFAFFRLVSSLDPRIFGSHLTGEFVSSKMIAFGYATQRPTFVFASVVNAAQCNASTG